MRVYIAGPMRGLPNWNFPAFDAAEERWRAAGHIAFSPAQVDRALKYGPEQNTEVCGVHLRHVINMDVACIMAADALALLPGWENSKGTTVELALAQFLGLPIYCAVRMELLDICPIPWSYYYDKFAPKLKRSLPCT